MTFYNNVSVVIRTYSDKRWASFVEAVESVLKQTVKPMEIVIVVDHNAALRERVHNQFPMLKVIDNPFSAGSSGAWNACITGSRGDLIVFFDDDAVADPHWLERLLAHYENDDVLAVGGAIEGHWTEGRPFWFPEEFDWVVGCTYKGLPLEATPVRNLIGCNMSFRREVFREVGGFRPGLGHVGGKPIGCDETELCIRIRQRFPDKILLYDPMAKVSHLVPPARTTWGYFVSRCFLEGRSKALVSTLVGRRDGLATESRYIVRSLSNGIFSGFKESLRNRNWNGLARAGSMIVGLSVTAGSYLWSTIALRVQRRQTVPPAPDVSPKREMQRA